MPRSLIRYFSLPCIYQHTRISVQPNFSSELKGAILHGSPSLLWMAADYGNAKAFQILLDHLPDDCDPVDDVPSEAPGGASIVETALCKGHNEVLQCIWRKPGLFPR